MTDPRFVPVRYSDSILISGQIKLANLRLKSLWIRRSLFRYLFLSLDMVAAFRKISGQSGFFGCEPWCNAFMKQRGRANNWLYDAFERAACQNKITKESFQHGTHVRYEQIRSRFVEKKTNKKVQVPGFSLVVRNLLGNYWQL